MKASKVNSKFLVIQTLGTLITGLSLEACNRPPTRPYMVELGSGDAEPDSTAHQGDGSDNPESPTKDQTSEKPNSDSDASKDTETGSKTPETKNPEPKVPEVKTPDPMKPTTPETMLPPKTEEPQTLSECPNKLSVGRIHQWHATYEGTMIPQQGLIVVKEGNQNVAKVEFVGEGWHVLPVWLKNAYEAEVDLSKSKNFVITYSATADMYVQLRPAFAWSGGDKWAAKIPSTGGVSKTLTVSFEDAASWTTPLGPPPHTLNEARAKARGFVFIGNKPTKFAVSSLVIDGYVPPCD